ncbi:Protein of unknown function [Lactobacillus delbrueckii subsp. lactis]|nr:Putative uncharacterized protein [Lactobacillus delbrueckii subsp. lactis]CDR82876.1 Protein of unknown function [Lactobacillus delbrueckii subsp. lactis]
MMIVTVKVIAP